MAQRTTHTSRLLTASRLLSAARLLSTGGLLLLLVTSTITCTLFDDTAIPESSQAAYESGIVAPFAPCGGVIASCAVSEECAAIVEGDTLFGGFCAPACTSDADCQVFAPQGACILSPGAGVAPTQCALRCDVTNILNPCPNGMNCQLIGGENTCVPN